MSALPPIATKNGEPLKRRRRARSRGELLRVNDKRP
jgi:hypothetical protein